MWCTSFVWNYPPPSLETDWDWQTVSQSHIPPNASSTQNWCRFKLRCNTTKLYIQQTHGLVVPWPGCCLKHFFWIVWVISNALMSTNVDNPWYGACPNTQVKSRDRLVDSYLTLMAMAECSSRSLCLERTRSIVNCWCRRSWYRMLDTANRPVGVHSRLASDTPSVSYVVLPVGASAAEDPVRQQTTEQLRRKWMCTVSFGTDWRANARSCTACRNFQLRWASKILFPRRELKSWSALCWAAGKHVARLRRGNPARHALLAWLGLESTAIPVNSLQKHEPSDCNPACICSVAGKVPRSELAGRALPSGV